MTRQCLRLIHAEPPRGGQLLQHLLANRRCPCRRRTISMATPTTSVRSGESRSIAGKILLSHGARHGLGEFPVLENRLADGRVPIVDDVVQHSLAGKQLRMAGSARQDVQLADAVHHSREHRLVGIDSGTGSRQHIGVGRHVGAALPKIIQIRRQARKLVGLCGFDSSRRRSTRCAPCCGRCGRWRAQIGDVFAAAIDRGGIRDAQQPRRQRRFRSHHAHDLSRPSIFGSVRIRLTCRSLFPETTADRRDPRTIPSARLRMKSKAALEEFRVMCYS